MKNIINQVYWDEPSETYLYGTKFSKKKDASVYFENKLMASGTPVMKWSSSLNYQIYKEVPSLPLLLNNQKYTIKLKIRTRPEKSAIFRLNFFDLQQNQIDHIVFYESQKDFIYPKEAKSYSFEIINGGFKQLEFAKLQIGQTSNNKNIFDDLFVQPLNKAEQTKPIVLVLVKDSKRSRNIEEIKIKEKQYQYYIGYISWQNSSNLEINLENWLKSKNLNKQAVTIFSSDEQLDNALSKMRLVASNTKIVFSNMLKVNSKRINNENWFTLAARQINQKELVKSVLKVLGSDDYC